MRTFILRNETNAKALWAFLRQNWVAMSVAGKPLQVDIGPEKTTRSIQANRRYWSILHQIAETGWVQGKRFSAEAWHEHCKRTFIGCEDLPGGQVVGLSTSKLSVAEFSEYMTRVEAWAATDLGIELQEAA